MAGERAKGVIKSVDDGSYGDDATKPGPARRKAIAYAALMEFSRVESDIAALLREREELKELILSAAGGTS